VNYSGPLFGKIGRLTIPLKLTSADVDAMEAKLARLDWRPVAAGLPTEEDAGGAGGIDVEWSDGLDIWQGFWYSGHQRRNATHWRPINLPPIITP